MGPLINYQGGQGSSPPALIQVDIYTQVDVPPNAHTHYAFSRIPTWPGSPGARGPAHSNVSLSKQLCTQGHTHTGTCAWAGRALAHTHTQRHMCLETQVRLTRTHTGVSRHCLQRAGTQARRYPEIWAPGRVWVCMRTAYVPTNALVSPCLEAAC